MKRMMGFFIFISVFVGVCFAGNFYIFRRLASFFGIKAGWRLYAFVVLLSVSYVAAAISEAYFHNFLTRLFYIIASTWLGVGLLFIFVLLVFEPVWLLWKQAGSTGGWIVVGLVAALSVYSMINAQILRVKEIAIPSPVKMKLVQLTDIHIGSVGVKFLERVVKKTNELKPDAVLITGDLMDPQGSFKIDGFSVLNKIEAPVFFVMGNHERYADPEKVGQVLRETKVRWLRNEAADYNGIEIIGIDDSESKNQVGKRLEGIDFEREKFNVLMYHRPDGFEAAAEAGVDLMLAGHTHNGQIFPFNFVVRLYFKQLKGLFEHKDSYLYVCPGTGTWGPRMRLGSASEIVLINLGSKEQ